MLKRISILMLAVFLFAGLAHAAKQATAEGTVEKMNKDSITLQVGGESKTFTFKKSMKVTVNGKRPASLTVKPGDRASVWADKNNEAEKINVTPQSESGAGSN
ncbi:MAG TPA: hypothetical protein VLH08_15565 [Acidobacteriota bacterium]|nr:hypothetical protein [Acidobacteriota bacterium]